jgi:hypothetical protein
MVAKEIRDIFVMRDITLKLQLLPRIQYAVIDIGSSLVVACCLVVCGSRIWHGGRDILSGAPTEKENIAIGLFIVFSYLLVLNVRRCLYYPLFLCARLEIRSNKLTMLSASGRQVGQMQNVVTQVRWPQQPRAVRFSVAERFKRHFDIPLWMIDERSKKKLLDCVGEN